MVSLALSTLIVLVEQVHRGLAMSMQFLHVTCSEMTHVPASEKHRKEGTLLRAPHQCSLELPVLDLTRSMPS